jgi:hypothetical protein
LLITFGPFYSLPFTLFQLLSVPTIQNRTAPGISVIFVNSDYPIQSVVLYPMANLVNPPLQQQPAVPKFSDNPADNPDFYVQGYPKLSYFFSQCPRYLHLRRFSALSVRIQLYRQHQLVLLEKRLMELEAEEGNFYCTDYAYIKTRPLEGHRTDSKQRNLYEMIKMELKEYGMKNRKTAHILLL